MAWSWSHTVEAYTNARANLGELPVEDLQIIFAEWAASKRLRGDSEFGEEPFHERKYAAALKRAKTLPDDTLADSIWEEMEQYATCDNGGHNAYCCPYGCHTVPFDRDNEETEE